MDFDNLRTRKGAAIVIHLEDESYLKDLEARFSRRSLEKKLQMVIDNLSNNGDTGKGTRVHVLINSQGFAVNVFDEDKFREWDKNPKKDWGRGELRAGVVIHWPLASSIARVLGLFDMKHFTGPTKDQVAKYCDNHIAWEISARSVDCSLCLEVKCPFRNKSFNEEYFEKSIVKFRKKYPAT